ncbi:hypothetical protein [Spiroplasma endosymbiont of Nebria brevicollis]|uniref:hypothetical protein n=1 Tax=Spiroplasma endosymbiont of Nebria brevicollis TaxID=3066284 RepID=UPI00313B9D4C
MKQNFNKSKNATEVFNKLLKVSYKDAILFIKEFPIEALEKGTQISQVVPDTVVASIRGKENSFRDMILDKSILEFNDYYKQMLQKKEELLVDFVPRLLNRYARQGLQLANCEKNISTYLQHHHSTYYEYKKHENEVIKKYCMLEPKMTLSNELDNFQVSELTLDLSLQEKMKNDIESLNLALIYKTNVDAKKTEQQFKPKLFTNTNKLFNELTTEINNSDIKLKILKKKNQNLRIWLMRL